LSYALFVVLLFLNNTSEIMGGVVPSLAMCEERVAQVSAKVEAYNADANNPIKITGFVAGCKKLEKAPQDHAV